MFTDRYYEYREEQIPVEQIGKPETRTARVERACHRCPKPIVPGQRYNRQCWLVDGEVWIETTHTDGADCGEDGW